MDAKNLAELYNLPIVDWSRIAARLERPFPQAPGTGGPNRHTCWLATIDADGSPHLTGIGALWVDGTFWFETGASTRKGRNLARNPRCTIGLALDEFDVVVEGEAHQVTDAPTVTAMADRWSGAGWPARPDESGSALTAEYSAPTAGPPPWHVYRIEPRSATVIKTVEPSGATRWRF
jgi:hypothetical protein